MDAKGGSVPPPHNGCETNKSQLVLLRLGKRCLVLASPLGVGTSGCPPPCILHKFNYVVLLNMHQCCNNFE